MKKRVFYKVLVIVGIMCALITINRISFAYTIGDMDRDGTITASDARAILKISGDPGKYNQIADINQDGKITAAEAREVLRVSSRLDLFKYNGYTVYNQNNFNSTVAKRGCSFTSLSMVLSKYNIDRKPDSFGSSPFTLSEISTELKKYNINNTVFKAYTKSNVNKTTWKNEIYKNLKNGKPVIALVRDNGTNLYTATSHYIVLVGIFDHKISKNLINVLDPNGGRIRIGDIELETFIEHFLLAKNNGNEMGFVCIK